jgi:outer membrane protein
MKQFSPPFIQAAIAAFVLPCICLYADITPEAKKAAVSPEVHGMTGATASYDLEANPVPVPPAPLDLQTCYELAVLRNETIGLREEDIRIAQARYWQAIGAVLPKVHVLASEDLQNKGSSGSRDLGDFGSGTSGRESERFSSRLNLRQPIFSGFRDYHAMGAIRAQIASTKHTRNRALETLYLDVADVFYQVILYRQDLAILLELQKALKDRFQELEKRLELGKSREGEFMLARSDYLQAVATTEQVRGLLGASEELLSFLINLPRGAYAIKDDHPLPETTALRAFLAEAEQRPDILAAIDTQRASEKQLSATKAEHWPVISADANYYLKEIPSSSREWNVGLTFDLPLFEGGAIEARVREREALVRQSKLNLEWLRRTAVRDVRVAYNNFISSVAQKVRLEEARTIADRNFEIQSKDYGRGVASNLEVLEALRRTFEVRRQLLDSEIDSRLNHVRLHVAAGEVIDP